MDYSIIDRLYDIYLYEDIIDAENIFLTYKHKEDFKAILNQYIEEQVNEFSKYFVSDKDEKNKVDIIVKHITSAFESLLDPIQSFMIDFIYKDSNIDDYKGNVLHEELKPHHLFSMNMKFLEDAVEKYTNHDEEFAKVKNLIEYVKTEKLLQKLYRNDSWKQMNFGALIANLYDKAKDKSAFEGVYDDFWDYEETLFGRVKQNCRNVSLIPFDKYRAKLNTSRQLRVQYGKLVFCKNLLSFYETGILVGPDGFIDCTADFSEMLKMKDKFKKLYSSRFDEMKFRKEQTNLICNPEIITDTTEIVEKKSVCFDNRMIMGFIVSANTSKLVSCNYKIQYLIHINIEDVNNLCSNYEVQLNILPHGDISKRLQLVRLDNWDRELPHRNIGNKLKTRTHIHLYNEFDKIRGKGNGEYDIAYNFNSKSTDFVTALNTFLDILDLEVEVRKEIYDSTVQAIHNNNKSLERGC